MLLGVSPSTVVEDVPHWPFLSPTEKDKDQSAGLEMPIVNSETGGQGT